MKKILFISFYLLNSIAFGADNEFKMNHDVFRCGSAVKFLFELEKISEVYNIPNADLKVEGETFEEAVNLEAEKLEAVSLMRGEFFRGLANPLNEKVQYHKNIKFVRSSPPSNIILPKGCSVEPISVITFNLRSVYSNFVPYSISINDDLFQALSVEGKIQFFLALSLDLQQVLVGRNIINYNIDLLQSREFLACWYNQECRPKTVADFHRLVRSGVYNLNFYEQNHILMFTFNSVGNNNAVVFDPSTGLIKSAPFVQENINNIFRSSYNFRGKKILYQGSLSSKDITFDHDGRVSCVPVLKGINVASLNDNQALSLYNPCWNSDQKIISAELFFTPDINKKTIYTGMVEGQKYIFPDSPTSMTFYENEAINWVSNAKDPIIFNKQSLPLIGLLKLYPSGKIQCLQVGRDVIFKTPNGQKISMKVIPREDRSLLYCFGEDGNFLKSYDTYYHEAINKIP